MTWILKAALLVEVEVAVELPVVDLEEEEDVAVGAAAQEEAQTLSSNLTDMRVFSSLREKNRCSSQKILHLANPSTEKREFP